jgi:hypothetical protein
MPRDIPCEDNNFIAIGNQMVSKMMAYKACAACNAYCLHDKRTTPFAKMLPTSINYKTLAQKC